MSVYIDIDNMGVKLYAAVCFGELNPFPLIPHVISISNIDKDFAKVSFYL